MIVTPQKPFDEEQLYFGRTKVDNNGSSSEKNVPHACVTNASSRGGDLSRSLLLSHHHTHHPFETNLQTTAGKMHFFGSNRFKPRRNFATINDDKQRRRTRRRRKRVVVDVVVAVVVVAAPVVNKKAFLCLLLYVVVCAGFCTSFWVKNDCRVFLSRLSLSISVITKSLGDFMLGGARAAFRARTSNHSVKGSRCRGGIVNIRVRCISALLVRPQSSKAL